MVCDHKMMRRYLQTIYIYSETFLVAASLQVGGVFAPLAGFGIAHLVMERANAARDSKIIGCTIVSSATLRLVLGMVTRKWQAPKRLEKRFRFMCMQNLILLSGCSFMMFNLGQPAGTWRILASFQCFVIGLLVLSVLDTVPDLLAKAKHCLPHARRLEQVAAAQPDCTALSTTQVLYATSTRAQQGSWDQQRDSNGEIKLTPFEVAPNS
ncbi:hypothetical protein ABBQ38_006536 [Trebouxia sp. C0009 RCD-2024]